MSKLILPAHAPGEIYAGVILGKDGQPDYYLFLLPHLPPSKLNYADAVAWAASVGGELPTRREQSLLFANCKEQFEIYQYWSSNLVKTWENRAWAQDFCDSSQESTLKSSMCYARAVRRVPIIKD